MNRATRCLFVIIVLGAVVAPASGTRLLIPMDLVQNDHLKAYGLAYWALERDVPVEWLLNFRGGAFMVADHSLIADESQLRGVTPPPPPFSPQVFSFGPIFAKSLVG